MTGEGQLPLGDALRLAALVAEALAYPHVQGVVQRDMKPENILLSGVSELARSGHPRDSHPTAHRSWSAGSSSR